MRFKILILEKKMLTFLTLVSVHCSAVILVKVEFQKKFLKFVIALVFTFLYFTLLFLPVPSPALLYLLLTFLYLTVPSNTFLYLSTPSRTFQFLPVPSFTFPYLLLPCCTFFYLPVPYHTFL